MTTAAARGRISGPGLRVAVTAILASPSFIYVVDRGRPSPTARGRVPLTSWELATRLSLFLWNTSPDQLLLDAAERDELADPAGLRRHVHAPAGLAPGQGGAAQLLPRAVTAWTRSSSVRREKDKLPRPPACAPSGAP